MRARLWLMPLLGVAACLGGPVVAHSGFTSNEAGTAHSRLSPAAPVLLGLAGDS